MVGDTDVESGHSAKNWDICGATIQKSCIKCDEKLHSNSSYASNVAGSLILTGGAVKSVYQTAARVNDGRNNSHKVGVMVKSKDNSISNDYLLTEL
ncbi:hypothetical protein WA026_021084 [Henosepilachna vigintioctopunctata]|uniref:Uncharacterized protein n=1 Tax=Henosepilachna vigintioctopunctata TaxID=420089 RepID=A0AAW1V377_9CUCU